MRGRRDIAAVAAYSIPTVGLFLQGLVYLTTPRFVPYHAEALGPASPPWRQTLGLTASYAAGGLISQWPSRRGDVLT